MDNLKKKYHRFVYAIVRNGKIKAVCSNHQDVTRIRALLINMHCKEAYGKPYNDLNDYSQQYELSLWTIEGYPILKLDDYRDTHY